MRKSQTATEYLIILAVVIIIAIIVIVALGGIPNIGGRSGDRASSAKLASGDIGLIEYAISNSSTQLTLRNNQGESARITAVYVNNANQSCDPATPILLAGESVKIVCNLNSTPGTRYEYDVNVTYTSLDVNHNRYIGKITGTTGVSGLAYTGDSGGSTQINGSCGNAINLQHTSAPTFDLCTDNSIPSVSGNGPWSWVCQGVNGGINVSCNATKKIVSEISCNQQNSQGFYNGSGTAESPFGICNVTMLQNMNNYLSSHFVLLQDIEANDTLNWNGGQGFEPIADDPFSYYPESFSGVLDGNNRAIFNLYINRPSENYVGLFRYLGGNIKDLHLSSFLIQGKDNVGSFYAYSGNGGRLSNVHASGTIVGQNEIGGIGGECSSCSGFSICSYVGDVRGGDFVGGILGRVNSLSTDYPLENCYADINVNGSSKVGGFVGGSSANSGDRSVIKNSYVSGTVTGLDSVGGFVGYYFSKWGAPRIINNSFSAATVFGVTNSGGFAGYLDEDYGVIIIENSHWYNVSNTITAIGYNSVGATVIEHINLSDFYIYTNQPLLMWNFDNIWSNSNNNKGLPLLQ